MYVDTLYVVNKAVTETRLNKSRLFHFALRNLENYKIKFLLHVLVLITPRTIVRYLHSEYRLIRLLLNFHPLGVPLITFSRRTWLGLSAW